MDAERFQDPLHFRVREKRIETIKQTKTLETH